MVGFRVDGHICGKICTQNSGKIIGTFPTCQVAVQTSGSVHVHGEVGDDGYALHAQAIKLPQGLGIT